MEADTNAVRFVEIAQGYLADPRFRDHYETQAEGLAQYVRDAVVGNAAG